ncbi:BldC family transcriptional regulator [Rhodococcus erythropolis]
MQEERTETSHEPDEEFFTPKQVAALFGVHPKTVSRWAKAGKIASVTTLGGHHRYRSADVHGLRRAYSNLTEATSVK